MRCCENAPFCIAQSFVCILTSPLHYRAELKFITEDCRGHVFFICTQCTALQSADPLRNEYKNLSIGQCHSMQCQQAQERLRLTYALHLCKVEKILKGSLDSIPSPSPSVKIQIMGRKVCLTCKGKTLLGVVNKLLKAKSLLTSPSNVLPYCVK